jgi:hypothetical protein
MRLSNEVLNTWKSLDVTREVLKRARLMIEQLAIDMGAGCTINMRSADETVMRTSFKAGQIEGLQWLLRLESDDSKQEREKGVYWDDS